MSDRIANINMLHQAGLAGMEAGICQAFGIEEYDYHDNIIYSAMVQAGVKRFRVPGGLPSRLNDSDFLKHRVEERSLIEVHDLLTSIEKSLNYDASNDDEKSKYFTLAWFLTELIYSLQTKSSMVSVLSTPNISDYIGKLAPDVLSSVSGLFSKIESVDIDLPVTKLHVPSKDIEIFQEIISSNIFNNYVDSQQLLEVSSENRVSTTNNIMEKGKSLYNKFSSSLDIKKASLSLIPVTSPLIDAACGKLPGKIANTLGNALSEAMSENRRITIYNYGKTHHKLLMDHYSAISKRLPAQK